MKNPHFSGNHHHYHQIAFSKHPHVQNMFEYSDPKEGLRDTEEMVEGNCKDIEFTLALFKALGNLAYSHKWIYSKPIRTKLF